MQPLVLLVAVFGVLVLPFGWWAALRIGLAAMFLMTASAHWGPRRADLVRMVPTVFSQPDLLVTISGILEILGAIGLLIPATARWAAIGLSLLLVAVFPANVRAAQHAITIAGRLATPLPIRTLIQVLFLTSAIAIAIGGEGLSAC